MNDTHEITVHDEKIPFETPTLTIIGTLKELTGGGSPSGAADGGTAQTRRSSD